MLASNDGELPARVLATLLGFATLAGASGGMLMLKEQATKLTLAGLLEQLTDTMAKSTPADFAMLSCTASKADGLATNAGPFPTRKSVVPKMFATSWAGAEDGG